MINRALLAAALALSSVVSPLASALDDRNIDGIDYLSGGVGKEEAQDVRAAAQDYSLAMTFTDTGGKFVSDVKVDVKKSNGEEVLSALSDGPMVLVNLPPGSYTVQATLGDQTQTRKVHIAKGQHRQVTMHWDTA
ncbi:MAG: hypothetical protein H6R10_3494 [Rhodocyclaceae bacterium]|nr:hypothetical protein [Rhodocyclaceae bacterium]